MTISDRSAEYRALVAAERRAENEALAITNRIREQVRFGKDGKISGRHPRRTWVWKRGLGEGRAVAQSRYKWVAQRRA